MNDSMNAAQSLYGSLFDWLVARINTSLSGPSRPADARSIGILDIFGAGVVWRRRAR